MSDTFASDDGTPTWWIRDIAQEGPMHEKARRTLALSGQPQRVAYAGDLRKDHPMVTYREVQE